MNRFARLALLSAAVALLAARPLRVQAEIESVRNPVAIDELIAVEVEALAEAPNPYDGLADAYRAAGRLRDARDHSVRAVGLAAEAGNARVETTARG